MEYNDIYSILNRHKRNITCDLCRKRIWFLQKGIRFVIRTKENIWIEYYHMKCLKKRGLIRKQEAKTGRWDDKRDSNTTTSVTH